LALAIVGPLKLVEYAFDHRTIKVLSKHHFRPGREDFREQTVRAMPKL
jgi:hypothetical protein